MRKNVHLLLWVLPLPLLAWIGHGLLFTSFMLYDDEGYILLSLRNFSAHGSLYDKVYTQYGPFFYAALDSLAALLRFDWTNTAARWFTLFNWLGTALLCALVVWRAARSWAAALFTLVGVFGLLWIMLQEPGHPGGLLTLLVAGAALIGARLASAGRTAAFAFTLGALGALAALIKINVGAFLVLSSGLWLIVALRPAKDGRRIWAGAAATLLATLAPFVLMRGLLEQPWVPTFALVAALGGLGALLASLGGPRYDAGPQEFALFVSAGILVTSMVALWACLHGTSVNGLLQGVFFEPLRHPSIYSFPVRWRPLVVPIALLGTGLLCLWSLRPHDNRVLLLVAVTRLATAAGFAIALLPWIGTSQAALALCYGVPLAGVFALRLRPEPEDSGAVVRIWLALLLVPQSLQAFPIAGSQLNWGTFLWVPLLALGVVDAVAFLRQRIGPRHFVLLSSTVGLLACACALLQAHQLARVYQSHRDDGVPLGLPGAERILLPSPVASALHVVSANALENTDVLFSLPGAFSFNQWTALPTPGLRNVTHWFSLLREEEQREIIESMKSARRPGFILQRHQLIHLAERGFPVRGALVAHLRHDYREALRLDAFALWVRRDEAFSAVQVLQKSADVVNRVETTLAPTHETIFTIEVFDTRLPASARQALPAPQLRINDEASEHPLPLPPGPQRNVSLEWSSPLPGEEHLFVFRFVGADDRTVAFARFPDPLTPTPLSGDALPARD